MDIAEAMAAIADEASKQGFEVRQSKDGMWIFQMGPNTWMVLPHNANQLLAILSTLIAAGLDWSHWDDPYEHRRD